MQERAVFASDFHLSGDDPGGVAAFSAFIAERVRGAGTFFILGDLFDLWVGPSQLEDPVLRPAFETLKEVSEEGVAIRLLYGNRDFFLGRKEAKAFGAFLPEDSLEVTVQGKKLFLTHGDVFCTGDKPYQRMKKVLRNPAARFLASLLPFAAVRFLGRRLRSHSREVVSAKPGEMTAIRLEAVESLVRKRGCDAVVCGHVHRTEEVELAGGGRLIVLSEWSRGHGTYAEARDGKIERVEF